MDLLFVFNYKFFVVQVLFPSLIGNLVEIEDGPAAVIGDENRKVPLSRRKRDGKARHIGWSESQKTCLNRVETSAERGNPMDLVDKKGISQIERTGLGFLFWGAMRNLFRYILNGYSFSFLILGYDLNI